MLRRLSKNSTNDRFQKQMSSAASQVLPVVHVSVPQFRFGVISDVQHARMPDGMSYHGTPRLVGGRLGLMRALINHKGMVNVGWFPNVPPEVSCVVYINYAWCTQTIQMVVIYSSTSHLSVSIPLVSMVCLWTVSLSPKFQMHLHQADCSQETQTAVKPQEPSCFAVTQYSEATERRDESSYVYSSPLM